VCDHRRGDLGAGAVEVRDRVAVLCEQLRDLGVEGCDALVEVLDVAGEITDAAGCDLLDEAIAEADPLEPPQLALAGEIDDARLGDRVDLIPVGAEPLDRLGAVADEAASCSSSSANARTSSGSSAGPSSARLRSTTWATAIASPGSVLPGP